jgi:hypothetical protein
MVSLFTPDLNFISQSICYCHCFKKQDNFTFYNNSQTNLQPQPLELKNVAFVDRLSLLSGHLWNLWKFQWGLKMVVVVYNGCSLFKIGHWRYLRFRHPLKPDLMTTCQQRPRCSGLTVFNGIVKRFLLFFGG